jgi:transcriptional regulator with XRE-family HTH domain
MAKAPPELVTWLTAELEARGWSQSELAEHAGSKPGSISQVFAGLRPGLKLCKGIAHALNVPEETVLVLAGHLTQKPDLSAEERSLVHKFRLLPPDDQKEFLKFIDLRLTRRKAAEADSPRKQPAKKPA